MSSYILVTIVYWISTREIQEANEEKDNLVFWVSFFKEFNSCN